MRYGEREEKRVRERGNERNTEREEEWVWWRGRKSVEGSRNISLTILLQSDIPKHSFSFMSENTEHLFAHLHCHREHHITPITVKRRANAQSVHTCPSYTTSLQSPPLHNQPSQKFGLLHATLHQDDCKF